MVNFTSHEIICCRPGHSCQHLTEKIRKKTTTKCMTHDMIHDHGKKPITIENCVIEHSQTHQLFTKLRQGKSQPGKRFRYPLLISIDFNEFRSPFIA